MALIPSPIGDPTTLDLALQARDQQRKAAMQRPRTIEVHVPAGSTVHVAHGLGTKPSYARVVTGQPLSLSYDYTWVYCKNDTSSDITAKVEVQA